MLPAAAKTDLRVSDPDGDNRTARLDEVLHGTDTRAFVVVHQGQVVFQRYSADSGPKTLETSFSVAKSFVSTLVGIAIDEGRIGSVDDPVTRYLPELAGRDERFTQITLRDLLTMSSGLRYEESRFPSPHGDDTSTYYGVNLRKEALEHTQIEQAPGNQWHTVDDWRGGQRYFELGNPLLSHSLLRWPAGARPRHPSRPPQRRRTPASPGPARSALGRAGIGLVRVGAVPLPVGLCLRLRGLPTVDTSADQRARRREDQRLQAAELEHQAIPLRGVAKDDEHADERHEQADQDDGGGLLRRPEHQRRCRRWATVSRWASASRWGEPPRRLGWR